MQRRSIVITVALVVLAGAGVGQAARRSTLTKTCNGNTDACVHLEPQIAFSSTRDFPNATQAELFNDSEIYLTNPDGSDPRRLTNNAAGDGFAALSPDGKRIVFDSNRDRAPGDPQNTSDLFLMHTDGSEQTRLTRGSSATWSPDGKSVAFHASASYYATGGAVTGLPIRPDPGSATSDSDIFVAKVGDLLDGTAKPANITDIPQLQGTVNDDPDWSPDGTKIVFTSQPNWDDPIFSNHAEIYLINVDGTGLQQLTSNDEEERGPAWSPDGTRIAYACRIGGMQKTFEICVMNADGSDVQQLTSNTVPDLTPTWSPDGAQLVFHRLVPGHGLQLFTMAASLAPDGTRPVATEITTNPGINLLAHWGELRVEDSEQQ
jgi:TolB protein